MAIKIFSVEEIQEYLKGKKLARVARVVGVSRQHIHLIATSKSKPSYDLLVKLSEFIDNENPLRQDAFCGEEAGFRG